MRFQRETRNAILQQLCIKPSGFPVMVGIYCRWLEEETRMHSSRMRTARNSSRLLGDEGCPPQCMLGYTPTGGGLDTPSQPDPPTSPPGSGPRPSPRPDPPTSPLGADLDTRSQHPSSVWT